MRRETTAKWIEEQITRILQSYPKEEVDRVIPVLLLLMQRDFGFENLEPRMQKAVLKVHTRMGISPGQPPEVIEAKIEEFINGLEINTRIIEDIRAVFQLHETATRESAAASFERATENKVLRVAPKVGAVRPDQTYVAEEMKRKATGVVRG